MQEGTLDAYQAFRAFNERFDSRVTVYMAIYMVIHPGSFNGISFYIDVVSFNQRGC